MSRILLLSALVLAACGPDDGTPDAGPTGPTGPPGPEVCQPNTCVEGQMGTLILGGGLDDPDTGAVVYHPIEDGDEVAIVPGFQGGQHIWVVLRAENVQTCYVRPRYTIVAEDGTVLLSGRFGGEFYALADPPGMFEFLTYAAFVSEPGDIHGRPTLLRAEVSDGCGNLIADERQVIPIDPRIGDPTP